MASYKLTFLLVIALLVLLPSPAAAFGAGNIASISKIEGHNWRHGDIEDVLKTVACLKGHKWTSMMVKRVYFGNWLRDYSQAVDVGTLKGVQAGTIRILVWVLAFMSFGYATGEFEVTDERLGVYRPEEHIDNPKDYADNQDARQFDPRLRGPVQREELAVDPNTGMKNYIANEHGPWATSAGYIKHSFARAIHYGRVYTNGAHGSRGNEKDLCEALRCLGQGLHCLEDFGAHTNYTELALRELGFNNVFPHTGTSTAMTVRGKHIFPLVTGTFGGVDFLHSVLGEATDHFTQSEIDEMNTSLGNAASSNTKSGGGGTSCNDLTSLLSKVPGTSALCQEAANLQAMSEQQAAQNASYGGQRGFGEENYSSSRASGPGYDQQPPYGQQPHFAAPPGSQGGPPGPGIPGMNPNMDPQNIVIKIYPILEFRDKVVRAISNVVSKIPGLESLIDKITETVTLFVMSLLAPFIQPIIKAASAQLKTGSSTVIDASGKHQYEPWTDPHCTDPTHSLLSKDHFSNVLNSPAGQVAAAILQYVAPRVVYAWDHPDVPVEQVLGDVVRVFHHPALRDPHIEVHRNMFAVVERWVHGLPDRGHSLNSVLGSESVRAGRNHQGQDSGHGGAHGHGGGHAAKPHGGPGDFASSLGLGFGGGGGGGGSSSSPNPLNLLGKLGGGALDMLGKKRDFDPNDDRPLSSHSNASNPYPAGGYGYEQQGPGYQQQQQQQQQPYQAQGYQNYGGYGGQQQPPQQQQQQGDPYAFGTSYQQGFEQGYQAPAGNYGPHGGGQQQGGYGYGESEWERAGR